MKKVFFILLGAVSLVTPGYSDEMNTIVSAQAMIAAFRNGGKYDMGGYGHQKCKKFDTEIKNEILKLMLPTIVQPDSLTLGLIFSSCVQAHINNASKADYLTECGDCITDVATAHNRSIQSEKYSEETFSSRNEYEQAVEDRGICPGYMFMPHEEDIPAEKYCKEYAIRHACILRTYDDFSKECNGPNLSEDTVYLNFKPTWEEYTYGHLDKIDVFTSEQRYNEAIANNGFCTSEALPHLRVENRQQCFEHCKNAAINSACVLNGAYFNDQLLTCTCATNVYPEDAINFRPSWKDYKILYKIK